MAQAEIITFRRRKDVQKLHNIIVVIKRFSDSHEHHVAYPLTTFLGHGVDLIEHLGRLQGTHQTCQSGSAEFTSHPAAYLCRDTDAVSVLVLHQNCFHTVVIF